MNVFTDLGFTIHYLFSAKYLYYTPAYAFYELFFVRSMKSVILQLFASNLKMNEWKSDSSLGILATKQNIF